MNWALAAVVALGLVCMFFLGYTEGRRRCRAGHPPTWYVRPEVAPENAEQPVDRAVPPKVFWARHDHPASDVKWD